jgi:cytidylate kinase
VITIDGPSGSGKGTVALEVARQLGWHFLDSGALYRVVGLLSLRHPDAPAGQLAHDARIEFRRADDGVPEAWLDGACVAAEIRTEAVSQAASKVAVNPQVRAELVQRQRDFRQPPGLVADGRDMGTVIFPDATHKFYLTASAEVRALRRHKQLIDKGEKAILSDLLRDITERDRRDQERSVAPLKPADDAILIDSTALSVSGVVARVLEVCRV